MLARNIFIIFSIGFTCFNSFSMDFFDSKKIESIATGENRDQFDSTSVIYTFDKDDINRSGKTFLLELLETIPGIHTTHSTQNRMAPIATIRGTRTLHGPEILYIENGREIKNIYTGSAPPYYNPLLINIKRIEVFIGPSSVLYGNNAFSGVINIIKDSEENEIGITAGQFDTNGFFLSRSLALEGNKSISISLEKFGTDGDHNRIIQRDVQSVLDEIFFTNVSQAPGSIDTNNKKESASFVYKDASFSMEYSFQQLEYGVGVGIADALSKDSMESTDNHSLSIGDTFFIDASNELQWQFNYMRSKRNTYFELFPKGAIVPLRADGYATSNPSLITHVVLFKDGYIGMPTNLWNTYSLDVQLLSETESEHKYFIKSGFNLSEQESSEAKNFGPSVSDLDSITKNNLDLVITKDDLKDFTNSIYLYAPKYLKRNSAYLSGIYEANINDLIFTTGLRIDYFSDLNKYVSSPRFSVQYKISEDQGVKIGASSAYRAPSFYELHASNTNNPVAIGNEQLKPEKMTSIDMSYIYIADNKNEFRVNLYFNMEKDIISGAYSRDSLTEASKNLFLIKTFGQEFLYSRSIDEQTSLTFSISKNNRTEDNSENLILSSPEKSLKGSIQHSFDNFDVAAYFSLSEMSDLNAAPNQYFPSCSCSTTENTISLSGKYHLDKNSFLSIQANNIFNHRGFRTAEAPIIYIPDEGRKILFNFISKF